MLQSVLTFPRFSPAAPICHAPTRIRRDLACVSENSFFDLCPTVQTKFPGNLRSGASSQISREELGGVSRLESSHAFSSDLATPSGLPARSKLRNDLPKTRTNLALF